MKKTLITTIGVAALVLAAITTTQAQFSTGRLPAKEKDAAPAAWYSDIIGFAQGVESGKQVSVAVYPTWTPGLTLADGTKAEFGGGVAVGYPVGTSHVLTLGRLEYRGRQMFAPSVTLTPNADFQLFNHNFTLFGEIGGVVPTGGTAVNGQVGAVVGAGVITTIWQPSATTCVSAIAAYERWVPVMNLNSYIVGLQGSISF